MATAKKSAPAPKAAKAAKATKPAAPAAVKPIKATMGKTELVAHLAQVSAQEPKAVKAVLAALEQTLTASVSKKGAGAFVMPGLFKVTVAHVPAKKARKGIDPFTKVERMFAAKPASVKVKIRALKKVKDAAA